MSETRCLPVIAKSSFAECQRLLGGFVSETAGVEHPKANRESCQRLLGGFVSETVFPAGCLIDLLIQIFW